MSKLERLKAAMGEDLYRHDLLTGAKVAWSDEQLRAWAYPSEMTLRERLLEALRRDVDTLAGPALYVAERELYEERIADYRARLLELGEEGD